MRKGGGEISYTRSNPALLTPLALLAMRDEARANVADIALADEDINSRPRGRNCGMQRGREEGGGVVGCGWGIAVGRGRERREPCSRSLILRFSKSLGSAARDISRPANDNENDRIFPRKRHCSPLFKKMSPGLRIEKTVHRELAPAKSWLGRESRK
jgi:hypothetical protein